MRGESGPFFFGVEAKLATTGVSAPVPRFRLITSPENWERIRQVTGPLDALLSEIALQSEISEQDIEGLYDNWFIETCDAWVVPYIGDLIGIGGTPASVVKTRFGKRASYRVRRCVEPV